ncbi:MAG: hypothetical protein ABI639_05680 [Thermoanaerobaculia bacterium]
MGWIEKGWQELSQRLAVALEPFRQGEDLLGVVHANQPGMFSAQLFAIGVTATRLIVLPLDRRHERSGEPAIFSRADLEDAAVWGWGGSLADFVSASAGREVRFSAGGRRYKLMILGGNALEDALSGADQQRGLAVLLDFLRSAKR